MDNLQTISDESIIEAIRLKKKNKIPLEEWELFLLREHWKEWYQRRMKGKRKVTITSFGDVSENLLSEFDTFDCYLKKEQQKKLYQALTQLTDKEQTVIWMYYFLDYSEPEIASICRRKQQTVHIQRMSALCKMRNLIV